MDQPTTSPKPTRASHRRPGWEIGLSVFVSGLVFVFLIWAIVMQDWLYLLSVAGIGSVWGSLMYTSSITDPADKKKAPYVVPGLFTILGLLFTMASTVISGTTG